MPTLCLHAWALVRVKNPPSWRQLMGTCRHSVHYCHCVSTRALDKHTHKGHPGVRSEGRHCRRKLKENSADFTNPNRILNPISAGSQMFWKTLEGRLEFRGIFPLFVHKPTVKTAAAKLAAVTAESALYKVYGSLLCQEKRVQLMAPGHKVTQTEKINYRTGSLRMKT